MQELRQSNLSAKRDELKTIRRALQKLATASKEQRVYLYGTQIVDIVKSNLWMKKFSLLS